jgi:hypothetical protein
MALTGIARKPGRLIITGCYVQMFGVTWHQPWREKGIIRESCGRAMRGRVYTSACLGLTYSLHLVLLFIRS